MSDNYGLANLGSVNLINATDDLKRDIICYLELGSNEYNGRLGLRVSSVFVILVTSCATTLFPVLATRGTKVKIPLYVYLFARYFGAGVIIATAFHSLLDPAYGEIGPNTCVGMTAGWVEYSWPPALALFSGMCTFLLGFAAERYVEKKYHLGHNEDVLGPLQVGGQRASVDAAMAKYDISSRRSTHQALHSADQDAESHMPIERKDVPPNEVEDDNSLDVEKDKLADLAFKQQIAAFLILEFGVIFHSVIIGLTLGTAGAEFDTLYAVIVFHQAFEGLGIGARLSAIPFPKKLKNMPWMLCLAYGFTTPIAISVALGIRNTYNGNSFTANVVSGLLDSISAGILMYNGFVELIARDFLFNADRTNDDRQLTFMICCLLLGAGTMALLGKWA